MADVKSSSHDRVVQSGEKRPNSCSVMISSWPTRTLTAQTFSRQRKQAQSWQMLRPRTAPELSGAVCSQSDVFPAMLETVSCDKSADLGHLRQLFLNTQRVDIQLVPGQPLDTPHNWQANGASSKPAFRMG